MTKKLHIARSVRDTARGIRDVEKAWRERIEKGDIRKLIEVYGLGALAEKVLLGEGCKTGLDVLWLDLAKIWASHKYRFGERTLGRLNLLQRYLRAKYG